MKHEIFKKGSPIDQKRIEFIETVVTRLARRANTSKKFLITPYPISNAVFGEDVQGTILRYMFPCGGTITKGLIRLGKKPSSGIGVEVKISDDSHTELKGFVVTSKNLLVEPDMEVHSGDRLEVAIKPSGAEKVTEVWISFLWVPNVKDVAAKSFLMDEIEKDMIEEFGPALIEEGTE